MNFSYQWDKNKTKITAKLRSQGKGVCAHYGKCLNILHKYAN